jgi:PAS domain S-box-containing protein
MTKVLVVDDNAENLYFLEVLLKGNGFNVMTATNGSEALEAAFRAPPDLIISDILMPVMDGFTLCRKWKTDERLRDIPFIFYTATYTESKDESFALRLGADRFILKPLEPDLLLDILQDVLEENYTVKHAAIKPLGEEMEFFRQHNEILFRKLEKKILDLEAANRELKTLEEQYRLIFENATDVIFTIGTGLDVLSVSPSVERILGYKPQDFIGRSVSDLGFILVPESFAQAVADIGLVLKGETIPGMVYRLIAKDGTFKYGEVSASPVVRDGKIIGMTSVARDITKRKRAEEELRRMNIFLNSIIENIPNMIFLKDAKQLRFVRFNRAGEDLLGHSREDLLGKSDYDFLPKEQADFFTERDREVLRGREVVDIPEEPLQTLGKGERIMHTKKVPILDEKGEPEYLLGISEDITERKKLEEALRRGEAKYRIIFEHAIEGIFQTTPDGRFIIANPALARIYGYGSSEEMLQAVTNMEEQLYVDPQDRMKVLALYREQGYVQGYEVQLYTKDKRKIWVSMYGRAIKDPQGNILYYEGITEDITSRKAAEEALRQTADYLNNLLDCANAPIIVWDPMLRITRFNHAFERFTGYSAHEVLNKEIGILFPLDTREESLNNIYLASTGQRWESVEIPILLKDGAVKIALWNSATLYDHHGTTPIATIAQGQDITSRKAAEEELKQTTEKLRKSLEGTIQAMSITSETRDPYTAGHQRRVSSLAGAIAEEMGLSRDIVDNIMMAGNIHDIGKMSIPAEILSKPGILRDLERRLIQGHPRSGSDILKEAWLPAPIQEIVLQHHERINGSGYPQGLRGDEILLEARIIAVADVVEAMASHRPYRPAIGIDAALEEIEKNAGTLYDREAAGTCLRLFREKGFGFE